MWTTANPAMPMPTSAAWAAHAAPVPAHLPLQPLSMVNFQAAPPSCAPAVPMGVCIKDFCCSEWPAPQPAKAVAVARPAHKKLAVAQLGPARPAMPTAQPASVKQVKVERQYSEEAFRGMLCAVLRGTGAKRAAEDAGHPSAARSLKRYASAIRQAPALQCSSAAATLQAQLAHANALTLKQKGNLDLMARKIFSEGELEYLASALRLYGDMGWPMDYQQIRGLMRDIAEEKGIIDWKTGKTPDVSLSYAREFVQSRDELKAYKASNIDPIRSKKATEEVLLHPLAPEPLPCAPSSLVPSSRLYPRKMLGILGRNIYSSDIFNTRFCLCNALS